MKVIWAPTDINPGMFVSQPSYSIDHACKVGYLATEESEQRYVLIELTDGMVGQRRTREELAKFLTENNCVPMPHKYLLKALETIRDAYI